MGEWLSKLDGLKTVIGVLLVAAYYIVPHFGPKLPDVILNTGIGFAGVGIVHKFEKGFGLVTKVLDIGHKVLDGLQSFTDAFTKSA